MEARCRFHSVNCEIALADVYDKVTFGDTTPAQHPSPGG
jgi:hypothetical protein